MLAIKTGELPVVEMLIKAGANVNASGNVSQPNGVDVGRRRAEKCRRDGKAASCERTPTSSLGRSTAIGPARLRRSPARSIVRSAD